MREAQSDSGIVIDGLGPGDLLLLWDEVMRALKAKKVIRSYNNPVGDFCEFLVAHHYGVQLARASSTSYDLETQDGKRIQVKGRRCTEDRWPAHFGAIGGLDESNPGFDLLVGVVLKSDFTVAGAWRAPWSVVRDLATEHKPWGPHRRKLTLSTFQRDPRAEVFELAYPWS